MSGLVISKGSGPRGHVGSGDRLVVSLKKKGGRSIRGA